MFVALVLRYNAGLIWCARPDPRSTLSCQIWSEYVHCVCFRLPKTTIVGKFWLFGAPVPTPFYRWEPNVVCYSRPTVYAYVPKFVSIGLFCRPLLAKTPNFAVFWTSASSVVASWQQSKKVEHECTTTNFPPPNGIKIVSVVQRLHGKIGRTISDVQKREGQTDKQTDKVETVSTAKPLENRQHVQNP